MLAAYIIIFLPLSAVIVVEIILALVRGCTTLINRRWKFFIDWRALQGRWGNVREMGIKREMGY